jgi:LPS sulfotransferase NodH
MPADAAKRSSVPGYLVCTHPRAGSTYFCQLLESTRQLGKPLEYFNEGYMRRRFTDANNPAHLPNQLRHYMDSAATENGIRSAKVFWFDLQRLARAKLLHHFRRYRFVLLERKDKVAQAISISRALRSGKLRADMAVPDVEVQYDFPDIKKRLMRLIRAERQWFNFFEKTGIDPLRCNYEALMVDPQLTIDQVAETMELDGPVPIDPELVSVTIQRDTKSTQWYRRFVTQANEVDPGLLSGISHLPNGR